MEKLKRRMLYIAWHGMISRCENPKNAGYKNYGGREIKVCERWHDFENFLADVGERPDDKSLDRWPDNDGDYEPGNWRWATRKEQRANCRPWPHQYKKKGAKPQAHPLRNWRKLQNRTIAQVSEIICCSASRIGRIETWISSPRISEVLKLCDLSEGVLKPWDFLEAENANS